MPLQAPSNFIPSAYTSDQQSIDTQRRLALALQQQGAQPLETNQSVGGWAIPVSPFAGLAKVLNTYTGLKGQKTADERERALAAKYQSDLAQTLVNAQQAASPHQEAVDTSGQGTGSMDMSGSAGPAQQMVPGSRAKMIQALISHPATMPIAMQQYSRDLAMEGVFGPQGGAAGAQGAGMSSAAGAAPAAAPQAGGTSGGGPDMATIQRALLSGEPSAQKWGEAMLTASRGIAQRPGAPVVNPFTGAVIAQPAPQSVPGVGINMGSQGATAYPVPGAAPAMSGVAGQVAGAQAAAKVPYENVTTAGGATMPAYMAPGFQMPPAPGTPAAPPQAVPSAPQPAPASTAPQQAPQTAQQWQRVGAPGTPAEEMATADAMKASERGLPFSRVVDQPGAGDPWQSMPRRAQPQGVGQSTFEKATAEHQASAANELATKHGALADAANQRLALNNQALSLVDKADTGPMAAQAGVVKNWLVSNLGIPETAFANTPSATYALQKDLLNAATQKAKSQFGARMTQQEVLLMLSKGAPNVDMPKAAIKYLIGSDNAVAQYQIKQANDLGRYMQNGGDPQRFESWYSQAFPLSGTLGGVHMGGNLVKDITASGNQGDAPKTIKWSDLGR